jgi:hypothetical protein
MNGEMPNAFYEWILGLCELHTLPTKRNFVVAAIPFLSTGRELLPAVIS